MAATALLHDQVIVNLTEDLLAEGTADLRWQLHDLVLAGSRQIIVDVSAVDRVSSTAVAALLTAHRACRARGGGVVIRRPSRRTLDLLHHTGLHRILEVEENP
ncbi:STAS domain-containing protein [Actinopolymorpha pittospori]|uniref:Anti-anti-sigma factor n=1 Tax=Actinopolymorpha pittospori TaxID=648752 RepID=A0A927MVK1_9ACTN|nr:anti-anti-sigma factor [Actinopolymorpha pittospori]